MKLALSADLPINILVMGKTNSRPGIHKVTMQFYKGYFIAVAATATARVSFSTRRGNDRNQRRA